MITNILQARDDMSAMFNTAWNAADWTGFADGMPIIFWQGIGYDTSPDKLKAHAKLFIDHIDGQQMALGTKNKTKFGLITVQSFGPDSGGLGLELAAKMANIAESVYNGNVSPNGVWFKRVRSVEVGSNNGFFQYNTLVNFQYDEIG